MPFWRRHPYLSHAAIAAASAFLAAGVLFVAFSRNHHLPRRAELQEVATLACATFWGAFLFGSAVIWLLKKAHDAYGNR